MIIWTFNLTNHQVETIHADAVEKEGNIVFVGKSKDISSDYIQYTIKDGPDQKGIDENIYNFLRDFGDLMDSFLQIQNGDDTMFINRQNIKFAHRKVVKEKEEIDPSQEKVKKKVGRPSKKCLA